MDRAIESPGRRTRGLAPAGSTLALLAAALVTATPAVAQPCGGMQDLGTLSGEHSGAAAVSADGATVVGWAEVDEFIIPLSRAFRWSGPDSMIDLGTLGGNESAALGVSADGTVAVGWANEAGAVRAFRWTDAGGMENLGGLPGLGFSIAYACSADGAVVVGSAYAPFTSSSNAFRWTAAGMTELIAANSHAYAVSPDGGCIVGIASFSGAARAFRWTAAGGTEDLGTLPGLERSEARGVSADGSVVVGSARMAQLFAPSRAFRWTAAGGMEDLGTLGGSHSEALAVSADGSVVVGTADDSAGRPRAFHWTASGGMEDLGTLGGVAASASSISADGRTIVGSSSIPGGDTHAFRRWTHPADLSADGTLDFFDVQAFLNYYAAANPAADFTADGAIDFFDVQVFLNLYAGGCG